MQKPSTEQPESPFFPFLKNVETTRATAEKGTVVFQEGSHPGTVTYLLNGAVKIYKTSEIGKEITLSYLHPGHGCLLSMLCILTGTPYPASGVAEEDVEAVVVSRNDFTALITSSVEARTFLFHTMLGEMQNTISLVEELAFLPLKKRLARLLLKIRTSTAQDFIEKTHEELARELGTSREIVSRLLKTYEQGDALKIQRGYLEILDTRALEEASL